MTEWDGVVFLVFRNIFSIYKCLIIEQPPFYAWRLNSIFYTAASDLSSHASCNTFAPCPAICIVLLPSLLGWETMNLFFPPLYEACVEAET